MGPCTLGPCHRGTHVASFILAPFTHNTYFVRLARADGEHYVRSCGVCVHQCGVTQQLNRRAYPHVASLHDCPTQFICPALLGPVSHPRGSVRLRWCEATLGFGAEGCGRGGTRVVRLGLRSEASSRVRSGNGGPGDRDGNIPTSSISVVHRTEWWGPYDTPAAFRPLPPSDVPPASFLRG